MSFSKHIFRANDIRGVFGKDFDLSFTETLSRALSVFLRKDPGAAEPKILLCHDARLSSPALSERLLQALLKEGMDVGFIGLAPSPLAFFLLHHYNWTAALIVTASHNPPSHNGFKIFLNKNLKSADPVQKLQKTALEEIQKPVLLRRSAAGRRRGRRLKIDPFSPYIQSLKKEFSLQPLPFVVDAGHGACGPLAKKVFKALGLSPSLILCEPDGRFPVHPPDPTVEPHLSLLKSYVKKSQSVFGAGFDGDGDRLGIVTSTGRFVLGDELGSLFLRSLAKRPPAGSANGAKTILSPCFPAARNIKAALDVKCSESLFQEARDLKIQPIMVKSGHRFAREALKKHKALLALELSGHIFWNDRPSRGSDDAIYNTLRLVEILNQSSASMDTLLPPVKPFSSTELRRKAAHPEQLFKKLRLLLEKEKIPFSTLDGLRFSKDSFWGLLRKSQTQSGVISLRFEAKTEKEFLRWKKTFETLLNSRLPHFEKKVK